MESRLAALEEELVEVRGEVLLLRGEVNRLRQRIAQEDSLRASEAGSVGPVLDSPLRVAAPSSSGYSLVSSLPAGSQQIDLPSRGGARPVSTPAPRVEPAVVLSWSQREAICRSVGGWIRACLEGRHRGASGRDQIPLSSRCWLVARDYSGNNLAAPGEESAGEEDLVVVDASGHIEFEYPLLAFQSGEDLVPLVRVAYIGEKLLVAVPSSAWHRKVNKRVLPQASLQKPVVVELGACLGEDRETELESPLCRCWMGFLCEDHVRALVVPEEGEEFTHFFLGGEFQDCLPSARGLVAAAQEHFAFETAAEEVDQEKESGSGTVEQRLTTLEGTLTQMASQLDLVVRGMSKSSAPAPNVVVEGGPKLPRRSALKNPKSPQSKYPSLDPSVVSAAIDAGVPEQNLKEMEKLLSGGAAIGKKSAEPQPMCQLKPKARAVKRQDPLSESESEEEDPASGSGEVQSGSQSDQSMVAQLAKIVTLWGHERGSACSC